MKWNLSLYGESNFYQAMLFFSGGVFVIVINNIGPKELHRRILRSKPVCVVAAPCDQINSKLLDVVDQVRNKHNLTFSVSPSRMPLIHCSVCLVQRLTHERGWPLRERWERSLSRSRKVVTDFALSRVLWCCNWWVDLSTSVVMSSAYSPVFISVKQRNIFESKYNFNFFLCCDRYLDL